MKEIQSVFKVKNNEKNCDSDPESDEDVVELCGILWV
jgi:hypothetical protein